MVNVCKLLSDQFTAGKAANGALTEPLREVFADRATGKSDGPVQAMVKIRGVRRF